MSTIRRNEGSVSTPDQEKHISRFHANPLTRHKHIWPCIILLAPVYPSIYLFIHASIRPFIPSIFAVRPFIHPSFLPSVHLIYLESVRPSVHPSTHSRIHVTIRSYTCPNIRLFIRQPFFRLSSHATFHLCVNVTALYLYFFI